MPESTSRRYPPELRERAVRMVTEVRAEHDSEWAAMAQVAQLLGIGTPETVRRWCRRAEIAARAHRAGECRVAAGQLYPEGGVLESKSAFFADWTGHSTDRGVHRH